MSSDIPGVNPLTPIMIVIVLAAIMFALCLLTEARDTDRLGTKERLAQWIKGIFLFFGFGKNR